MTEPTTIAALTAAIALESVTNTSGVSIATVVVGKTRTNFTVGHTGLYGVDFFAIGSISALSFLFPLANLRRCL